MQIGIAILPSRELAKFAKDKAEYISSKYNTVGGLKQPPHITIKWPFDVSDLTAFEKYCERVAKQTKPFKVECNGYGFFGQKVIFLKALSTKHIVNLHLRVVQELNERFKIKPHYFEGPNQQFHLTIAFDDLSKKSFFEAQKELISSEQPHFKFRLNRLALLRNTRNKYVNFFLKHIGLYRYTGDWVVHKEFPVSSNHKS